MSNFKEKKEIRKSTRDRQETVEKYEITVSMLK
jgi:hypothetical protein